MLLLFQLVVAGILAVVVAVEVVAVVAVGIKKCVASRGLSIYPYSGKFEPLRPVDSRT